MKNIKKFMFCFVLSAMNLIHADPYDLMRYSEVFNQETIAKKYEQTLRQLGCYQNISCEDQAQEMDVLKNMQDQDALQKSLQSYQKECLAQVTNARIMTLVEPGIKAACNIGMWACIALITLRYAGKDSTGGSFSTYGAVANSLYSFADIADVARNLIFRPNNNLQELENRFAVNQVFIPKVLWPKIIYSFGEARSNGFTRENHVSFLNFVLDLTTFKVRPEIVCKEQYSIQEVKQELRRRIKLFFENYDDADFSVYAINRNVAKFIDCLVEYQKTGKVVNAPRYLFLQGTGGLGKTFFVQQLALWVEELMPTVINFEQVTIELNNQLEGDGQCPGVMLSTLRNQLKNNNLGSLLMIDEATWLNSYALIDAAKRVFNGDMSTLKTTFLNITDMHSSIQIPPMLIFLACNQSIEDDALASRFDIVHFPTPKTSMLLDYALQKIEHSAYLKSINCDWNDDVVKNWVHNLADEHKNFRYIDSHIESVLESRMNDFVQVSL